MAAAHRWGLVWRERERLLRLARARLGPGPDAEDCVQEALIRAAVHDDLDEDRVGALLTTITLRLCVDHHRRQVRERRAVSLVGVHAAVPTGGAVSEAEHDVCEQAVGRWLLHQAARLGEREQQVLLARARGLSATEAARTLRITPKAAESAYTRARGRLRLMYQAEMAR
jgi:RNA polymerase sigma factor (sigma-70 family)